MSGDSHREDLFHPIKTRRRRWVYFLPLFGVPNCVRLVFVVSVSAERRRRRRRSWLPSNEAYFLRVTDRRRHWRRTEQRKPPSLEFGLWTVQKHWGHFDCHRTISTIQRCISPVFSANIRQWSSSSSNERTVLTFSSLFILFMFFAGSARNSFASLISRVNELRMARRSSATGECLSLSYRSTPDSWLTARDDIVEQCQQALLRALSSCRYLLRKRWGVSPLLTDSRHRPNVNWNNLERDRQLFLRSEEKRSLPAPLATFNPLVIMFAPRSASIFTDSWWPSIAARSRQVRVWSFRTWRRWCCWMASKRRFSTVFVGIVKSSARVVWLPREELSKRFSVNWGMLICSIRAARSWALF